MKLLNWAQDKLRGMFGRPQAPKPYYYNPWKEQKESKNKPGVGSKIRNTWRRGRRNIGGWHTKRHFKRPIETLPEFMERVRISLRRSRRWA